MKLLPLLALVTVSVLLAGCPAGPPSDPRAAAVRESLAANPDAAATRVLLLGFDAADLDIIDAMVSRGELPAFARMRREGASGKLRSIVPLLSPVIWTTIATGKGPEAHGILDWEAEDPVTGEERPATSGHRRVEALWNILGSHGTRVGVVGWLVTWPAEPVNGFVLSNRFGFLSYRQAGEPGGRGQRVYPPELFPRVSGHIRDVADVRHEEMRRFFDVTEERFRSTFARGSSPDNPENNLRLYYAAAETYRRASLALWREEKPRFQATYYKFLDSACHLFMTFAPPRTGETTDEEFARYRGAVAESYRYTDRKLAEAMDAADENTVILVVSDHGFKSGDQRPPRGAKFLDRWASRWHRPFGVFLAWGKGVRPGARVTGATVYDIAPTVLGLMGYPRAEDMPGRFLEQAFRAAPPAAVVPSYEGGRRGPDPEREAADGDDPMLEDLRALGYLGGGGEKKTSSGHLHLVAHFISRGMTDEALRECRAVLEKDPESARAHNFHGRILLRKKRYAAAAKAFEEAVRREPELGGARVSLALTLKILGEPTKAIRELRAATKARPDDAEAWFHLGRSLMEAGEEKEGLLLLRRAVAIEPDLSEARNRLGMVLLRRGEVATAIRHFRAAVDLRPEYVKAWNNLGVALLAKAARTEDPQSREETLDEALATMNRTIRRFPEYAKSYGNRARIHFFRGQRDAAAIDLEKALELDPDYDEARRLLQQIR